MAVPIVRRERPPDPPALRSRPEIAGGSGRAEGVSDQPPRAAARLRQPSFAKRGRPAGGADPAWPRRHLDHADLHPRARRTAEKPGPRPAPFGGKALTVD